MSMLYVSDNIRLRPISIESDAKLALPWYRDMDILKGTGSSDDPKPYDIDTVPICLLS
jgi:hypothetical protein